MWGVWCFCWRQLVQKIMLWIACPIQIKFSQLNLMRIVTQLWIFWFKYGIIKTDGFVKVFNSINTVKAKYSLIQYKFDGLVQERHNSIANALELCVSCTNPSTSNCRNHGKPMIKINQILNSQKSLITHPDRWDRWNSIRRIWRKSFYRDCSAHMNYETTAQEHTTQ